MKKISNYKVSLYHNVLSPPVEENFIRSIYDDIKCELYAEEIYKLREHIKAGKKKEADQYKKSLPAFTTALFTEKRIADEQYIKAYYGTLCLDFDNVENPEEVINEIAGDAYVKFAFISPSGTGFKCVVETDCINWNKHGQVFRQTSKYFFEKYGISPDESCKDVNRLCFLSSDKNAIWRDDNILFKIQDTTSVIPQEVTVNVQDSKTLDERYESIQQWVETKVEFKEKQRHRHVLLMAGECNRWGLRKDYVLGKLVEDYKEESFSENEIVSTTKSVYSKYAHEHGKFLIEPPVSADDTEGEWISARQLYNMPPPADMWLWEQFIRKGCTFFTSPPGLGKSTFLRFFGIHICYGHLLNKSEFAEKKIYAKYHRLAYVAFEESVVDEIKLSLDIQFKALNLIPPDDNFEILKPTTNNIQIALKEIEKKHKRAPFDAIILDSYNAFYLAQGKETNNTLAQRDMVDTIDCWAKENDVAVIVIHHPIKANYNDEPDLRSVSGAGGLSERARAVISLCELRSQNPECIYLTVSKGNLIKPIHRRQYIEIHRDEKNWTYEFTGRLIPKSGYTGISREDKKQDSIKKRKKIITEMFTANGTLQHGQFCEIYKKKTGLSLVTGGRHLAEMVKENIIEHDEKTGHYSLIAPKVELAPTEEEETYAF